MFNSDGASVQLRSEYDESTAHFMNKIKEIELDISKKIYESDHEKAENKLIKKQDEKFNEVKEQIRLDKKEFTTKLASLKTELS